MNKYHSKKITRDGMTFDSLKEYRRWTELALLANAGQIRSLHRQVRFDLIPTQREESNEVYKAGPQKGLPKPGKTLENAVFYVADFTYWQDGKFVVEDVKGYKKGAAYNLFVIKRKLMLYIHGIRIKET